MSITEVFFWFCKEQKIMDILIKMYYKKKLGTWRYEHPGSSYFEPMTLDTFLKDRLKTYGFLDIFWDIQPYDCKELVNNVRYKKARSKWNAFVKNNVRLHEDFIKVGDTVELARGWQSNVKGVVTSFPPQFNGTFMMKNDESEREFVGTIVGHKEIIVNGVPKEPKFYIKRKRKCYGLD